MLIMVHNQMNATSLVMKEKNSTRTSNKKNELNALSGQF